MSKKLTESQIRGLAAEYNVDYAALRAVVEVESRGSGFDADNKPIILFEPHIYWRELDKKNYTNLKLKMQAANPKLLYPKWKTYPYGPTSTQHQRLADAANLVFKVLPNLDLCNADDFTIINNVKEAAYASCSWGLGQVMGFNWEALGYNSIQEFVSKMEESEAGQLDAMLRFCKVNNLIGKLQSKNFADFARGYNGSGYEQNNYDGKLLAAFNKFKNDALDA